MRTAVIYESMFGNTARVARAIGDGLGAEGADVDVIPVADAGFDTLDAYDVVVIGAPTHAFSLSRPSTRLDAARRGARVRDGEPGVREWLTAVSRQPGAATAAFDTRAKSMRHWPGSAARHVARALRRRHITVLARPASFYVAGTTGPLVDGEEERARAWGAELMRRAGRAS